MSFPQEIEETLDPAEMGRHGCLIPQIDGEGGTDEGHCDAKGEDDEDD